VTGSAYLEREDVVAVDRAGSHEAHRRLAMNDLLAHPDVILDSLNDGVYVCDRERTIVYWSKGAERITGWTAADVIGRRCLDDVLSHVDKDGRLLCGKEHCPLHRSMVTSCGSTLPIMVFAKSKSGKRVPMQVATAPIRDAEGRTIGGVETFRDMSEMLVDLERAKTIQALSLEHDLPGDPRIRFWTFYNPNDIVGGDYFAIKKLDGDQYGFLLADLTGHGISAALYTMHLNSLWIRHGELLVSPAEFASTINTELRRVVKDESFAAAVCGVIDAKARTLRMASSGGPPILVFRADGEVATLEAQGVPFGIIGDAAYAEVRAEFQVGDCLLMFTDGAYEIHDAREKMLDVDGLVAILRQHGYPAARFEDIAKAVEEDLLKYSNAIRLVDDVTFIEARFTG
jgi:sigma-B regulation protein RsbU (phosphoserine phosphatase)